MRPASTKARRYVDPHALPRATGERRMGRGDAPLVLDHPRARRPNPAPATLTVGTFNILHSGLRAPQLAEWFETRAREGRLPDVLALQETNLPVSVRLARTHGYHLAYFGREARDDARFVNGKAWLSRFRIAHAMHALYGIDDALRNAALKRRPMELAGVPGELEEDRGALRITLRVWGTPLDLYTLHHTLGDPAINAAQLTQLRGLLLDRDVASIIAGDFNANLNLLHGRGSPRAAGRTRSVEAYLARYGHLSTGAPDNAHDARVRSALNALRRLAPDTFERAPTAVRLPEGGLVSPARARRRLVREGARLQDEPRWRLMDIGDGATLALDTLVGPALPASGKRYDGIFATRSLRPLSVEIDRSGRASDHAPVQAVLTQT